MPLVQLRSTMRLFVLHHVAFIFFQNIQHWRFFEPGVFICQSENYLGERETRSYKIHIPPAFPMHFHYFSKPQSQCQPCQTSLKHWAISFTISRAPSFSIAEAAQTNTETLWKTYVTGQPNAAWGGSPISTIGSKLDVKLKAAPSHRHTTIRLQWAVITRFQPDTPVIPLMKAELS